MRTGHRTVMTFLSLITTLLVGIVGLCSDWPVWAWPAAAAVLAAVLLVISRVTAPREDPMSPCYRTEPDRPVWQPERRERTVRDVPLPSAEEDYDFLFSATVRWCPVETEPGAPDVNAAGLAVHAVLEQAREITARHAPRRSALVQHEVEAALGQMVPERTGRVLVLAENVTLGLAETDSERLRRLSTVRKDEAVWEHERNYERNKRDYLGRDVLQDTGSAVVWWLAKNDDHIKRTVDDIGTLAQLTSAARNEEVPEHLRHMVPYPVPTDPPEEPEPSADIPEATQGLFTDGPFGHVRLNGDSLGPHTFNGHESPAQESAADRFAALLKAMGVPSGSEDEGVLARAFAEAAASVGRTDDASPIRERFDPAAREANDVPGPRDEEPPDDEATGRQWP